MFFGVTAGVLKRFLERGLSCRKEDVHRIDANSKIYVFVPVDEDTYKYQVTDIKIGEAPGDGRTLNLEVKPG